MARFNPHPYQRAAIEWIMTHPQCGLFMQMGLGKSVCTLTAIQRMVDDMWIGRVLVVAPKKVAESTWSDEVAKWDHLDLRVSVVAGTPAQRLRALATPAEVYVMGRDSVVWLQQLDKSKRHRFDMIVLDELTSFKNSGSQRFKAMKKLRNEAVRIVGLTGTPAPNGLLDLWGQVYCLDGGERLGPFVTKYRTQYFNMIVKNNIPIKTWPKPGAEETIMEKIGDICFSLKAQDYLTMPDMILRDVAVTLPPALMARYRKFAKEYVDLLCPKGTQVTAVNAAALINKLAQFANGCVYDDKGTPVDIHDAKLEMLMDLVEQAGSPVLCFYQYKHDVSRIMAAVPRGLKVRQYTGPEDLHDWNEGKIDLLLAHPASTAYGLNMQRGGHVIIWFGTGWNLEYYQQANARLHRQGQKCPVTVVNLITKDTVDERMLGALHGKADVQDNVVRRLAMDVVRVYAK